ncbi:hypothetical protein L1987_70409 [Smallanthus sonchifolius]|uniref:Uncharacterized protein n=1 Tax=Smallanthus sonchifolius TaxID=185202 RepID=A0ACB9APK6_9ASTR|nr:hypothetical protein L1987_70409 [Smallanthus sonchifolius]
MEDEIFDIIFSDQVVISDQVQVVNTQVPVISPTQAQVFQDEDVGLENLMIWILRCNDLCNLKKIIQFSTLEMDDLEILMLKDNCLFNHMLMVVSTIWSMLLTPIDMHPNMRCYWEEWIEVYQQTEKKKHSRKVRAEMYLPDSRALKHYDMHAFKVIPLIWDVWNQARLVIIFWWRTCSAPLHPDPLLVLLNLGDDVTFGDQQTRPSIQISYEMGSWCTRAPPTDWFSYCKKGFDDFNKDTKNPRVNLRRPAFISPIASISALDSIICLNC